MAAFLGIVRPPCHTLFSIIRSTRQFSFTNNNSILISTKRKSQFKSLFTASIHSSSTSSQNGVEVSANQSEIIFIGTGTSEGIPRVSCLTNPLKTCPVCTKATEPGNRNRRMNTGILVRHTRPSGNCNILIDVGKFFYHSALRWFPAYGIRTIDAVIITHSHADAIGGMDDLRDWTNNVQPSVPIYVASRDFEVMKKTHYYLVDKSGIIPGAAVSELQFNIIKEDPFVVHDLEDCELLIMDALRPDRSSSTHFGLPRALDEVRKIKPKRTLFTGMMHLMDHEVVNERLLKLKETEGIDVQLSYDGLRVPVSLQAFRSDSTNVAILSE